MGHSAGTEITELALGLRLADAEVYIPTGYTHMLNRVGFAQDFGVGGFIRAAQDDYFDAFGDARTRTKWLYAPLPSPVVDENIVNADNARAMLLPSGEIYTVPLQASGAVMGSILSPVLLVLAEKDLFLQSGWDDEELALFTGSRDKTLYIVPHAGHSFMLHRNAPDTMAAVTSWLSPRLDAC